MVEGNGPGSTDVVLGRQYASGFGVEPGQLEVPEFVENGFASECVVVIDTARSHIADEAGAHRRFERVERRRPVGSDEPSNQVEVRFRPQDREGGKGGLGSLWKLMEPCSE
jgi:hypothetical protein